MNVLEVIAGYDIDSTSFVLAGSDISNQGELGERLYRERITEMTMQGTSDVPIELVPLVYGYTVQEAIRTDYRGAELLSYANDLAKQFYSTHKYIWAVKEDEQRVDVVTGEVKKKKGEKGDLARVAFVANKDAIRSGDITRQQMLAIIVEEADMSKAGASTYYAKFKKEYNM